MALRDEFLQNAVEQAAPLEVLPPDEESLLAMLGQGALSAVGGVAAGLDVPGSMVRDLLAGENPFDQLMNPFGFEDRATGRDVLREWDFIGEEDTTANWWAGLGAEMATDPFLAFSLATAPARAAGKAAAKGGLEAHLPMVMRQLEQEAAEQAAQTGFKAARTPGIRQIKSTMSPQDALDVIARAETPGGVLGTGSDDLSRSLTQSIRAAAGDNADEIMKEVMSYPAAISAFGQPVVPLDWMGPAKMWDVAGEAARFGRLSPWARGLAPLVDTSVRGALDPDTQKLISAIKPAQEFARENLRENIAPIVENFHRSGLFAQGTPEGFTNSQKMMNFLEGVDPGALQGMPKQVVDDAMKMRQSLDQAKMLEDAWGIKVKDLDDKTINYMPRQWVNAPGADPWSTSKAFGNIWDRSQPFMRGRKSFLENYQGGTSMLNRMSIDPDFSGIANAKASKMLGEAEVAAKGQELLAKYGDELLDAQGKLPNKQKLDKLVRFLSRLDPAHVKTQSGMYNQNAADTFARRMAQSRNTRNGMQASINAIRQGVNLGKTTRAGESMVSVGDVVKGMGRNVNEKRVLEHLSTIGIDAADELPKGMAGDITRAVKSVVEPEEMKQWMQIATGATAKFKELVTGMFPAFHARNFISGQIQNALNGAFGAGPSMIPRFFRSMTNVHRLSSDGVVQGAKDFPWVKSELKRLGWASTDENGTRLLRRQAYASRIAPESAGQLGEAVSSPAVTGEAGGMPGLNYEPWYAGAGRYLQPGVSATGENIGLREGAKQIGKSFMTDPRQGASTLMQQHARRLGNVVEDYNRMAPWLSYMEQGYSPSEAARQVRRLQVDYSKLTPAEQKYARLAMPFYSFRRGMSEYVLSELWNKPGGALAQTLRAQSMGQRGTVNEDDLVPEWMGNMTLIDVEDLPVVGEWMQSASPDTKTYATGTGFFMHEDPLRIFNPADPQAAGYEVLSSMNPYAKTPLEYMTGQQSFFQQGRPWSRQESTTGRILRNIAGIAEDPKRMVMGTPEADIKYERPVKFPGQGVLDRAIGTTPFSRMFSEFKRATDLRNNAIAKAVDIGLGIRLKNVSPKQRQETLQNMINEMYAEMGGRKFTKTYMSKQDIENLPEEQREKVVILKQLESHLSKLSRERRKKQKEAGFE